MHFSLSSIHVNAFLTRYVIDIHCDLTVLCVFFFFQTMFLTSYALSPQYSSLRLNRLNLLTYLCNSHDSQLKYDPEIVSPLQRVDSSDFLVGIFTSTKKANLSVKYVDHGRFIHIYFYIVNKYIVRGDTEKTYGRLCVFLFTFLQCFCLFSLSQ